MFNIPLLLTYIKLGVLAVVLVVFGLMWWHISRQGDKIEGLQQQVAMRDGMLKLQNEGIEQLKVAADKRVAEAQKDLAVAKTQALGLKSKATVIYKTLPSNPADDCKSALELGNQQ